MTTHYTMTIRVQAWRVAEDGSLPEEAMKHLAENTIGSERRIGERDDREVRYHEDVKRYAPWHCIPVRHYDYWWWWSETLRRQLASAGDWIVSSEYGVEAMTDEQFQSCCTEPDSDAEFVRKHPFFRVPFCNGSPLSIQRGDRVFDTDLAYVQEVGRGKYLEDRSHYNRPPTNPDIIERLMRGESCAGTCGACGRSTEVGDDE
jgi:hypothetical protein